MEGTPAEQAQQLKAEYERKLAEINTGSSELSENNSESAPVSPEHQAVSEVTEEAIKEQVPGFTASSHAPLPADGIPVEAQAKVQEWINATLSNPATGISMAKKSDDIGLIDIFHKALTSDAMYQALVQRGEIQELK